MSGIKNRLMKQNKKSWNRLTQLTIDKPGNGEMEKEQSFQQ